VISHSFSIRQFNFEFLLPDNCLSEPIVNLLVLFGKHSGNNSADGIYLLYDAVSYNFQLQNAFMLMSILHLLCLQILRLHLAIGLRSVFTFFEFAEGLDFVRGSS
jgi:hypothetical protein